nr:retrovirus-related Pol polyprotein from transposon TNT 1-94 [Tanacetum cinerariifolium]
MPSKDNLYNGRKGIGFENPSYFKKAKDLRPTLYDEKVIGLGYTSMFLTHFNEALEIEKFKRSRENKIEFAYNYGNLNASYVNKKINFEDDYFQEIINPDCDKIDSPFQQTSSLKPYVPNVILEKFIIDLKDEVKKGSFNTSNVDLSAVSISKLNKKVKRYSRKDLLSCNNYHLGETSSASVCNDAMNLSCNPRMCDLLDDNNFFIFDDKIIKVSPVSKMTLRKKPCDSMIVHSKSKLNKSLPRIVHKWLLKLQPLAEPVAKWIPRIVQNCLWIIDSGCSKHMTGNRALLMNFVEKFLGTVRFGNNDFAMIAGYRDVVIGSMTIKKVYYVEGLGHN